MSFKIGQTYHGFKLMDAKHVAEINSDAKLLVHKQSGARLLYLGNDDDNKVFSVTFRTPPEDSTGVPHIVEHSVLCGSRKFPIKEPFVELVKGSLNTFLNAMTFPDKTMYPVASRNEKDFRNLMDVYLDAVFYPQMLKTPAILMQEGWHYDLPDKNAELTYKGVVYNEMKGVFSSPDAILEHQIYAALFPDTTYGVESGGDPEYITDLTQEQFAAFHKKYYHPANSYIFLYGDLDLDDQLKFLDEAYLQDFTAVKIDSRIPLQKPFKETVVKVVDYPVSPQESTKDKTFITLNVAAGKATDAESYLGLMMLEHILLETPAAPLKKALLDAGLGKEVFGSYNKSILQPTMTFGVSGANPGQVEEFKAAVAATLAKLANEGLDKKLVESSVNIFEFHLREANYGNRPKGLVYNMKCLDSWLYDEDPLIHLAYEPALAAIKRQAKKGYFEQLIKTCLLNNTHQALVALTPSCDVGAQKATELKQKLANYKESLSPAQLAALVKQTKALKERQETSDSPEALESIPLLELKDIDPKAEELVTVEQKEQGIPVLLHPYFTNQIAYVNLYFNIGAVAEAELPYVFLLADLLGKVDTARLPYTELAKEINIHTGGFAYDVFAFSENADDETFTPMFRVKAKALVSKLPEMFGLLGDVAGSSLFNDSGRLKELIRETKAAWDTALFRRGQQVVASRLLSYVSPVAKYNETGLLTYYKFIAALEDNLETRVNEIGRTLAAVAQTIFNKDNLLAGVTCTREDYEKFSESLAVLIEKLGSRQFKPVKYSFKAQALNEGLLTSGKVQYVAKGANFRRLGYTYHGSMKVLETILRYDYLWNRIRVQGGAYGAFTQFDRSGNVVFGSYRDPNLAETVRVYDETVQYLNNFTASQVSKREMTKYIIGTMSALDTPLTPQMKGERADAAYIRNISQADLQQERAEVLATRQEDIRKLADVVDAVMQANYLCVLGGEQKIKASKELFGQLVTVID
ncbi:insulinase family protein [Sporomusa termitida]|uniref:Peptidase M16C associated n=1 Tax=Sporomusa termitida TaxID=2377 RepID=A0A517DXQ9_9FIRM|nr:insulinase family protein [Sporomusa termitida]QDR82144.1 Peptidase M16C associated [Sporomusa termitida]